MQYAGNRPPRTFGKSGPEGSTDVEKDLSVAAAVIIDGNRILAAQRSHGELAGGWEFPGGKIEPGETAEGACIREVQEEIGVTIADLKPFVSLEYEYPSFHMSLQTFTCRIAEGAPVASEHAELRWLTGDELDTVAWLPADVQVVNALRAYLLSSGTFTASAGA